MREELKRIFIKGGVISPIGLKQITKLARALDLDCVHFGSRQDILLPVKKEQNSILEENFPEYKLSTSLIPDYIDALSKDKKNKDGYLGCILLDQNHNLKKYFIEMNNELVKMLTQFFEKY